MTQSRRSFLLGAGAAGIALAAPMLSGCSKESDQNQQPKNPPEPKAPPKLEMVKPPLLGNPDAPGRFMIWGSYTCPYTAVALPVLRRVVLAHPDRVNLEWRHFPTHQPDPALHVAGLGFEGDHFWGFTSRVLTVVHNNYGNFRALTPRVLAILAQAEGGSMDSIEAAYADQAKWDSVKADLIAGQLLGIKVTPGIFYGGYFLTPRGVPRDLAAFEKSLVAMVSQG